MTTRTKAKIALVGIAFLLLMSLNMLAVKMTEAANLFPWQDDSPYVAKIICPTNAEDDFADLQLKVFDRQADGDIRLVYHCVAP